MSTFDVAAGIAQAAQVSRATVAARREDGTVEVTCDAGGSALVCDVLDPAVSGLDLAPGDAVLVWWAGEEAGRPVILGRIARLASAPRAEPPAEITLEAAKSLTLRVGDGSITLRGDGRIVIKGTDVVSHARRQNRIRGGSVAIN
jgi:hypothetical protein